MWRWWRAVIPSRGDEAYERVLGDAMAGEATLFARQDYVEGSLRIVIGAEKTALPSTNTTKVRGSE